MVRRRSSSIHQEGLLSASEGGSRLWESGLLLVPLHPCPRLAASSTPSTLREGFPLASTQGGLGPRSVDAQDQPSAREGWGWRLPPTSWPLPAGGTAPRLFYFTSQIAPPPGLRPCHWQQSPAPYALLLLPSLPCLTFPVLLLLTRTTSTLNHSPLKSLSQGLLLGKLRQGVRGEEWAFQE